MRTKTAEWYECKIQYLKTTDDGKEKNVTEIYVVDALSFSEAEARFVEAMKPYVSGDSKVIAIAIARYDEIFFSGDENDDRFFRAKVQFVTVDSTGRDKNTTVYYLVQARDIETARRNVTAQLEGLITRFSITGLNETQIIDIFEHE
jgi:hypothetical protein